MATVPRFLSSLYTAFTSAWSFARTWVANHHIPAFLLIAWSGIRLAVYFVSSIFNLIFQIATTTQSLVSSSGPGASSLTYFSVVNSFFPVVETFTFLAAILSLRGVVWLYVFLRAIYKNIPLKST